VLMVTVADLVFRARQFLIAVVGTGLVLAVALVLSGLAAGFSVEVDQTVHGLGAQHFVLSKSSARRLTAFNAFPQSVATLVGSEPGVQRADPFLLVPGQVEQSTSGADTVNIAGVRRGGLGDPVTVASGHPLDGPGQVVIDNRLKLAPGSTISFGHHPLRVVGTVADRSLLGGVPVVYMGLADAQQVAVGGRPLVTAVLVDGTVTTVPPGLEVASPDQVVAATVSQLNSGVKSVRASQWMLWVVAVIIVAALLYVAALERRRDFAVLKALGSSSGALFGSLVLEAVMVTLLASIVALVLSVFLSPLMAQPVDIPTLAYVALPFIAVIIGALASLVALRRVTGADPAAAFS